MSETTERVLCTICDMDYIDSDMLRALLRELQDDGGVYCAEDTATMVDGSLAVVEIPARLAHVLGCALHGAAQRIDDLERNLDECYAEEGY